MNSNTFEQKIVEIINHEKWSLIRNIPLWIMASVEYNPDFWYWFFFEKNNNN